jgi:hypothetical protein
MKHVKLFESWHKVEVCSKCNGTGHVGTSKQRSIENILIKGTEKEFLDYIDDADFVENAADLFKKNGVYTVKIAKLVAALGLTREQLQDIIKETNDGMDDMQELLDTGEEEKRYRSEDIEKIKDILKNRAEVLAILRGR